MKNLGMKMTAAGFHGDVPDAVKAVRVDGPRARRLSDLALHSDDLRFAAQCLEQVNNVPDAPPVVRQALWRCAVVYFMKCFGDSKAKDLRLDAQDIYEGKPNGLEAFNYFRDLRHKHMVHDENSYAQSIAMAALNNGDKPYKIEQIACVNSIAETLEQDNFSNLHALIGEATDWVAREFDAECDAVKKELEALPYATLVAREEVKFHAPRLEDIGKRR